MAQSNVIVRLSLKDADAVQRGLVALGADGEKALKRIEAAGRTPSAGLKALGAASDELKGKFGQLSGNAGVVGSALEALGPRGLLAAAGIGALVAALGFAIGRARDAMATFDALGDSAARIGVSLKTLQELQYGFGQSGVSAEQLETALTKLNDTLGDVLDKGAETPKEVARAFAELGISLQEVLQSGGDLGVLLPQIAEGTKNLGTQAERTAVLKTLMGKSAAALIPVFLGGADGLDRMAKAAHDAGAVFDEEMARALGDAKDKLDALDQVLTVQNARAFGQFAEQTVQAKQAWVEFVTALNDWGDWLDRQNWLGGLLNWLDQVIEKTRQVGPLGLIDEAKRLEGVDSSGGGLRVEMNTPRGTSSETAVGGNRGAWPATQQEQAKADAALKRELDAIDKWRQAYLVANGDVVASIEMQRDAELRNAEETIKDAQRLEEARAWIHATFDLQEVKAEQEKNTKLAQAAKDLQEQLAKIDKDIATQHIQALRDSGRHAEAASEDLKQQTADIETGGGTVDQQDQLLANARLRIQRQLSDALAREDDVLGSARAEAARRSGKTIEALELEHQQRLQQIRDSSYSTETRTALTQLEDEKSARLLSDAEQTRFSDWLGAQPPLILDVADRLGDLGSSAADAFAEAVINGGKLSTVLEGLAADLQKVLLRMAMMKLIEAGANALTSSLTSTTTPTAGSGETGAAPGPGTGGLYARGAAFDAGNVIPFARGGVVDRPTLFPMARGAAPGHFVPGVMGEAGPEGVLPLRRTASGDLGVAASGGGAKVTVNVINNAGAKVTTEEKTDDDGGLRIDVMIDAVEHAMAQRATRPGTTLNRALTSAANPVRAR